MLQLHVRLGLLTWHPVALNCPAPPALTPPLLADLCPPPRRLLRHLAALHGAPELRPARQFSLAAFCLRAVLDDFSERMGPDLMQTCTLGSSSSSEGGDGFPAAASASAGAGPTSSSGAGGGAESSAGSAALAGLGALDGLLDSRFLHLCCPTLDHARQLFSAASSSGSAAGGQRAEQARRVKKIRPTAPSGAAAARAALGAAPSLAAPQQDGSRDLLKLQLQRAFLEQYSTDEHKVGRGALGLGFCLLRLSGCAVVLLVGAAERGVLTPLGVPSCLVACFPVACQ